MQYMDFSLLLYIGMLAMGVLVGSRKSVRSRELPWLGRVQFVALIALIAVLGVEIGADDKVISSLGEIGLSALIITRFCPGRLYPVCLSGPPTPEAGPGRPYRRAEADQL